MPTADPTLSDDHVNEEAINAAAPVTDAEDVRETEFFTPFDGTRGRAGGVYLDMQERVDAEELRAKSEGREPDYDNPPAVAGTPLTTKDRLVDNSFANPSSVPAAPVKQVDPVSTLDVDYGVGETEIDTSAQEQEAREDEARRQADSGTETTTETTPTTVTPPATFGGVTPTQNL